MPAHSPAVCPRKSAISPGKSSGCAVKRCWPGRSSQHAWLRPAVCLRKLYEFPQANPLPSLPTPLAGAWHTLRLCEHTVHDASCIARAALCVRQRPYRRWLRRFAKPAVSQILRAGLSLNIPLVNSTWSNSLRSSKSTAAALPTLPPAVSPRKLCEFPRRNPLLPLVHRHALLLSGQPGREHSFSAWSALRSASALLSLRWRLQFQPRDSASLPAETCAATWLCPAVYPVKTLQVSPR